MSAPMKKRPTKGVEVVIDGTHYSVPKTKVKSLLNVVKPYEVEKEWFSYDEVFGEYFAENGGEAATLLRGARELFEMTQKELAEATGIGQGNISKMEKGERPITKESAQKLAKALNIDYKVLL